VVVESRLARSDDEEVRDVREGLRGERGQDVLEVAPTDPMSLAVIVERFTLAEESRSPFSLRPGAEGSQGFGDHSTIANSPAPRCLVREAGCSVEIRR
jgi:hypothetical protein